MADYPGFVGPTYTTQNKVAAADRLVNWYVEKIESGTGKATYQLLPCPGFTQFCDLGTSSPIRGQFTLNGVSYAVAGGTLYQLPITLGGSATTLATGINNPDDSLVSIAGNGDGGFQLVIASAGSLYVYDITAGTLTAITGVAGTYVTFQDGYFVALDPTTSRIYLSALEDGSSWDALDVAQRSDQADKWLALLWYRGELVLPGSQTGSVYFDSGDPDFPFTPNPSGKLDGGILAPRSACVVGESPMWLQQNAAGGAMVIQMRGYTLQRVSTHAIEYAFSTYSALSDADAFVYQEQGHTFYCLNFPSADHSWAYDLATGLWHERGSWDGDDYGVLPVRTHAYANGVHLVGDRTDGVIWQMASTVYTDTDGTGLRRMRRAPHLCAELNRVAYDRLQLDLEVGVGLATGQGSDPQVMLRWSNDGGQSFGNVRSLSAGAVGAYSTQAVWHRLGMARDRVFEVSVSDPIPWRLVAAYLETRAGVS